MCFTKNNHFTIKDERYWLSTNYCCGSVENIFGVRDTIWEDLVSGKCMGLHCYNDCEGGVDVDNYTFGHADEFNNEIQFYYYYFSNDGLVVRKIMFNSDGELLKYEQKTFFADRTFSTDEECYDYCEYDEDYDDYEEDPNYDGVENNSEDECCEEEYNEDRPEKILNHNDDDQCEE